MAITTLAGYNAAKKQSLQILNISTRTIVANSWFSMFRGTVPGANTANGVVPVMADWSGFANGDYGYIDPFAAGAKGYLTSSYYTGGDGIAALYDMVFKAGAYSFNSNVTLASQPSYASRMPNGTDFTNTELWLETATGFTGNVTVTVTYTNQDGVAGRSTNLTSYTALAPTQYRCLRFPLQSGDTGVQKVESVVSTVATVGTFNILVLRKLAVNRGQNRSVYGSGRVSKNQDLISLCMPEITSNNMCPTILWAGDATPSATNEFRVEIASG